MAEIAELLAMIASDSDAAAANACIRNMSRVPGQMGWTLLEPLIPGEQTLSEYARVSGGSSACAQEPTRDVSQGATVAADIR